ncbi:MAG: hypothetical protein ACLFNQ_05910 [Spirochaetaceae bacterium]
MGTGTWKQRVALYVMCVLCTLSAGALPRGFGDIEFGYSREEVGTLLSQDPNFNYRGDPDVQFLPLREQVVIDTAGFDFIRRGYFQFHDNMLYSIILSLNGQEIDYFSVYERLSEQHGEPVALDPRRAVWEDETTRLTLERPLEVKYLDMVVFRELQDVEEIRRSDRAEAREEFLEQF